MAWNKIIGAGLLGAALWSSLACSGKSTATTPAVGVQVTGQVDFQTGLSKARQAASSLTGNVSFMSIGTGTLSANVPFVDNAFTAYLAPGDYDILVYRNDGKTLRKLMPSVSPEQKDLGKVDLDSTVVAELVDKMIVEGDDSVQKLADLSSVASAVSSMANLLNDSLTELAKGAAASDNALVNRSLLAQTLKREIKMSVQKNIDVTSSSFKVSDEVLAMNMGNTISELLTLNANLTEVVVPNVGTFSDAASAANVIFQTSDLKNIIKGQGQLVKMNFEKAVLMTVAADFSSSASSVIDANDLSSVLPTIRTQGASDYGVIAKGRYFYVLGRYGLDTVEKFDIDNPSVNLYGSAYSTKSSIDESTSNPKGIIFKNASEGLLLRRNKVDAWKVNLNASTAQDFHSGNVSFKAYDDGDGKPEMVTGLYVKGKYFVAMQRLDANSLASNLSYVAVLDENGNELETGKSDFNSGLKGIALPAKNPNGMVYDPKSGLIYVVCLGQYGSTYSNSPRQFTGGIVTINPDNYDTRLLIDDDANNESTTTVEGGGLYGGLFTQMAVVNERKAYVGVYSKWKSSTLKTFDPSTGVVSSGNIAGLGNTDIRDMKVDSKGRLWVLSGSGVSVLDTETDTVIQRDIQVGLLPSSVDFCQY